MKRKFYIKSRLSDNISVTPEGYLLCKNVPITHKGDIEYRKEETPFAKEATAPTVICNWSDDIFDEATAASFEMKPITIEHPQDFVDSENWEEFSNGMMTNVRRGEGDLEDHLITDLLITTKKAIDLVKEQGIREVSLGYDCSWELVGENKVERYKLRGNHCALVEAGRAGVTCAIKDSKEISVMAKKVKSKWASLKKAFGKAADELEKEEMKKVEDSEIDEAIKAKEAELAALKAKKAEDEEEEESEDEESEEKKSKDEVDLSEVTSRLDKLEGMFKKLIEAMSGEEESEDEESKDDDLEEEEEVVADDEYEDEEEESEDEECSSTDSMIEILAPSKKFKGKDAKLKAICEAYKTEDGKNIINSLTGGKKPTAKMQGIDTVFVAAAQLLKAKRADDFSGTKSHKTKDSTSNLLTFGVGVTAAQLNEANEKYWNNNK